MAIAAGGYFSLALKSDGTVVAWGDNNLGQVNVPAGLSDIVGIAAGISHAMALKSNGTVIGWGDNEYGQATAPEGLSHVVAIAAGEHHSLALKSDGTVEGWGKEEISPTPEGLANVAAIVAGQNRSLALHTDGTVTQWPEQFDLEYLVPPPANLSQVVALATCPSPAFQYNLALKSNGTVVSWGNTESFYPGFLAPPESLTNAVNIAVGDNFCLAITHPEIDPLLLRLSLNPATGILSGTPTQPGTYRVEFAVTDSQTGLVGRKTFEIVVDEPDIYTVSYLANGGMGSIDDHAKTNYLPLVLSGGSGFTRFGHGLTGWNTAANGSGDAYDLDAIYKIDSDLTLYAQWQSLLRVASLDLAEGRLTFTTLPDGTAGTIYTVEVSPTLVNAVWRPALSFNGVGPDALVNIYLQRGDTPTMFFRITAAPD